MPGKGRGRSAAKPAKPAKSNHGQVTSAAAKAKAKKSNYGQSVSAVAKAKRGPFSASSPKPVKPPKSK